MTEIETIRKRLINNELYGLVTHWVNFAIDVAYYNDYNQIKMPFDLDTLISVLSPKCPKCDSSYTTYDDNTNEFYCVDCDNHFSEGIDFPEIDEWWEVSKYLAVKLKEDRRRVLTDGTRYYWGREAMLVPVKYDCALEQIAKRVYEETHKKEKE